MGVLLRAVLPLVLKQNTSAGSHGLECCCQREALFFLRGQVELFFPPSLCEWVGPCPGSRRRTSGNFSTSTQPPVFRDLWPERSPCSCLKGYNSPRGPGEDACQVSTGHSWARQAMLGHVYSKNHRFSNPHALASLIDFAAGTPCDLNTQCGHEPQGLKGCYALHPWHLWKAIMQLDLPVFGHFRGRKDPGGWGWKTPSAASDLVRAAWLENRKQSNE